MPAPKKDIRGNIVKAIVKTSGKINAKIAKQNAKPVAKKLKPVKPELKGALTNPKSNVKTVPSAKTKAKQTAFDAKMKYGRK